MNIPTTYEQLRKSLNSGAFSVADLVHHYTQAISANAHLNAFLEVFSDEALSHAHRVDQKLNQGTAGKLAGMIIGIKDVFCLKGHALTAGSRMLTGFQSQFTATAIQKLLDEDAIIIGRQNCDEFAMGSSNENSAYGPVRNAANPDFVPGGSSGGSAVAVQAGLCFASIASDTGGSIRQPAAFCGVVGAKPTYSRISRYGLVAYGSSFDSVGPITQSVEDAALLTHIMSGKDPADSTSSSLPAFKPHFDEALPKYRIAYFQEPGLEDILDGDVRAAYEESKEYFRKMGHEIIPVSLPYSEYFLPTYYILTTSEASSNLSRYDGIRFGHRTNSKSVNLENKYKWSRSEGFGPEVKRRIMLGTFALSADYHDAFFTKAQQVRRLIQKSANDLFQKADLLLMPVSPNPAFRIGTKSQDPLEMYFADIFTVWANLAGVPAISIPVSSNAAGLPIGLQLHAKPFEEHKLFHLAKTWEKAIGFNA